VALLSALSMNLAVCLGVFLAELTKSMASILLVQGELIEVIVSGWSPDDA
jgi:hypothetical protein